MATNKVKNLKKPDWQNIAKSYKIKFEAKNAVRYLVEKIAEKIKVDDKIVKLEDLKQAVHDVLTKKGIVDKTSGKLKSKAPKKTENKKSAPKKKSTVVAKKPAKKDIEVVKEDIPEKSNIEILREKCTSLGLAFGSAHTEQDLQNLVGAVSGGGGTNTPNAKNDAVVEVSSTETDSTTDDIEDDLSDSDKQMAFAIKKGLEQFGDDFDNQNLNGSLDPMATNPSFTFIQGNLKNGKSIIFNMMAKEWRSKDRIPTITPQIQPKKQPPKQSTIPTVVNPVTKSDPTSVAMKELQVYQGVFMGAINGHFRLMSKSEVIDILNGENYPFTYQVNHHRENSSLIEIILTSRENSLRLPSENKNQWISISG
jgi:hypothetical protein